MIEYWRKSWYSYHIISIVWKYKRFFLVFCKKCLSHASEIPMKTLVILFTCHYFSKYISQYLLININIVLLCLGTYTISYLAMRYGHLCVYICNWKSIALQVISMVIWKILAMTHIVSGMFILYDGICMAVKLFNVVLEIPVRLVAYPSVEFIILNMIWMVVTSHFMFTSLDQWRTAIDEITEVFWSRPTCIYAYQHVYRPLYQKYPNKEFYLSATAGTVLSAYPRCVFGTTLLQCHTHWQQTPGMAWCWTESCMLLSTGVA